MTNPINAQDLLELIEGYKSYEADCRQSDTLIDISRANLYKTIRHDLEDLLPTPRTLADMLADEVSALVGQPVKFPGDRIGQLLAFDETWCAILVDKANTTSGWPELMRARRDLVTPVEQDAPDQAVAKDVCPEPQPGEAWLVRCDHATMDTIGWQDYKGRWWVQDEDVRPTKMGRNHRVTPLRRLVPEQQPRVLTTEADYAACKRDTVVREHSAGMSFEKIGTDFWSSAGIEYADVDMAGVTRTVLWEREA